MLIPSASQKKDWTYEEVVTRNGDTVALAGCGQVAPPALAETPPTRELVEEALYVWDCVISLRGRLGDMAETCQQAWRSAAEERRESAIANLTRSGGPDRNFTFLVYDCVHDYADPFGDVPLVDRVRTARRCLERAQHRWRPTKPPAL